MDYDLVADGYDARHAANPRNVARTAVLDGLQLAAVRGHARVLEVGCGTGRLLVQVRAPVAIGVDVSAAMLAQARARGLEVLRADAHALPFADRSFDGIVAGKGVFRYLDAARAFAECARVLAPGGVLALHQYGARTWSVRGRIEPPRGVTHVGDAADIAGPARAAGLELVAFHRFRSVRLRPYLLRIPGLLDHPRLPQLWSHCIAVLARRR